MTNHDRELSRLGGQFFLANVKDSKKIKGRTRAMYARLMKEAKFEIDPDKKREKFRTANAYNFALKKMRIPRVTKW